MHPGHGRTCLEVVAVGHRKVRLTHHWYDSHVLPGHPELREAGDPITLIQACLTQGRCWPSVKDPECWEYELDIPVPPHRNERTAKARVIVVEDGYDKGWVLTAYIRFRGRVR
jgi:hypothetical protein